MQRNAQESLLSSTVSVAKYFELEAAQNREKIATFVYQRFHERYIRPFGNRELKNGFIMMASACLMIESLESFWLGWKKSPNSGLAFCQFLDRNPQFVLLQGSHQEFYKHIRCGIMHQGETTGGWHIRRDLNQLFDPDTRTIDATRFLAALDECLKEYCDLLKASDWESPIWSKFRKKMKAVCANTSAEA